MIWDILIGVGIGIVAALAGMFVWICWFLKDFSW